MCEYVRMFRSMCRHRDLIMYVVYLTGSPFFYISVFTSGNWLIYTLSSGSYAFWLLVQFGCWVTPVKNPVTHSFWYLLERLCRVALLTEAIKARIPSKLPCGLYIGEAKRVTSLPDALELVVLILKGHSAFQGGHLCMTFSSGSTDCSFGLLFMDLRVLIHCNQLSILVLLFVILLHPHFCK